MNKYANRFLILFAIFWSLFAEAQEPIPRTSSKRARKEYNLAIQAYSKTDYRNALMHARKASRIDRKFPETLLLIADIYQDIKVFDSSVLFYEKALLLDNQTLVSVYNILGGLYFRLGRYEESIKSYETFILRQEQHLVEKTSAKTNLKRSAFALKLLTDPVPYQPINLGDSVNSANDEYINVVSVDDKTLLYTVRSLLVTNKTQKNYKEEFFITTRQNGFWSKGIMFSLASGSVESEGALSISPDGKYLFFTSCHRSDGYGSCDLYFRRKTGEHWSEAQNLGAMINSSRWDSQPNMSSDGRTLYFASNRPGGFGGSDIWKSVLQSNGRWGQPENLGPAINSTDDEMSPFLHYDGQTLYFSSKGHFGLGGSDLFFSRLQDNGQWSEPQNLGYPINTHADEISLVINAEGDVAYISADSPLGKGGYDIYSFNLYKEVRPVAVTYLNGVVKDAVTLKPLQANFELIDLSSSMTVVQSFSDPDNGEFIVVLPSGKDYALHVNKIGYLFYSEHLVVDSVQTGTPPVRIDISLRPIQIGQAEVLRNIFFAHNSYIIESQSKVELDKLVVLLKTNPHIKIEVIGHTDNTGSKEYNLELSARRAQSVVNYLVEQGISHQRLSSKGSGDLEPVETNDTAEGRARNRRTEFRIIN